MRFELLLTTRFLIENRGQTLLITLGIAVGVAVLVFLNVLIDGLQDNLIDQTVGRSPHIVLTREDQSAAGAANLLGNAPVIFFDTYQAQQKNIDQWPLLVKALARDPAITAVVPVAQGPGFVSRGNQDQPVVIRGMDLEAADRIYHIRPRLLEGSGDVSAGTVLIGVDLAGDLNINSGDVVLTVLPGGRTESFLVGGIFDLGVQNLNKTWLVMSLEQAASLLGIENYITTIELQVGEVFMAADVAAGWNARLPGYRLESWQETNTQLLSALQSQSSSSFTIQFFVLLAVTLAVASVLAINAVQKSRQIGILKAIGIRTTSVARVFLLQGAILGLAGSVLGCAMGVGLVHAFVVLTRSATGDPLFPLATDPLKLVLIVLIASGSATLAAYLPARRSARLDPIEVIRSG